MITPPPPRDSETAQFNKVIEDILILNVGREL